MARNAFQDPARRWIVAAVVCALLLGGAVVAAVARGAGSEPPKCFGAASRDPQAPCTNRKLNFVVRPTPQDALIVPNSPCAPLEQDGYFGVCGFGVPAEQANGAIALVGDSHATHWRAAVDHVAQVHGWAGMSLTLSSCVFSKAETLVPDPARSRCRTWNRQVPQWLKRHPEVHTIFFSHHRGASVVAPPGVSQTEARVQGFIAMWQSLPASVRHIIVIRDVPTSTTRTPTCVVHALQKHQRPQFACARKRSEALKPDAAAIAATRLNSKRVQIVDLTPFFCSKRLCYPVVGGVLTHKDIGHITVAYATTLAPYLLRRFDTLMSAWPDPPPAL